MATVAAAASTSSSLSIGEKTVNFVINNVSRLKSLRSQRIMVENVPWQIEISHRDHSARMGGDNTLAIHLHSLNFDPGNHAWSYAAAATIELLTFNVHGMPLTEVIGPWIFNRFESSWSRNKFIRWTDLFDRRTGYVKQDQIRINIKVSVQKLESPSFGIVYQQIFNVLQIHFRIENVRGLMAAASARFVFSEMSWKIIVRRNQCNNDGQSYLSVMLYCFPSENETIHHWVRTIFAEFRLESVRARTNHMQRFNEPKKFTNNQRCHVISKFISWCDLMDPRNGYIENNYIAITVSIRDDSRNVTANSNHNNWFGYINAHGNRHLPLELSDLFNRVDLNGNAISTVNDNTNSNGNSEDNIDDDKNANTNDLATTDAAAAAADHNTSIKWSCSICLENMTGREVLSSTCGHVYCKDCILTSIKFRLRCPNCQAFLNADKLHPLYLPS